MLWRGPLDKLSSAAAAVERNDSGVGSDSGLSVSYPKLPGQEKTTDGATCRDCDSALAAATCQPEHVGGDQSGGGGGASLCTKCAKRKGERKEIIR